MNAKTKSAELLTWNNKSNLIEPIEKLKAKESNVTLNQDGNCMVKKILQELMVKAKKVDLLEKSPF